MKNTRIAAGAAFLAAAGLSVAGLSGCTAKVETKVTRSVSADDLQKNITDQLTQAGDPPKSVTCNGDLIGEAGKSTTCDVVFSDTNSVQATVTATGVEGSTVSFDLSPSLTKEQLEKAVSGLTSTPTVTCDSGLDGAVGASATCEVTVDGDVSKRSVVVDGINGLEMDLSVTQILPKQKIEEVLMQKLNADGTPAETVECVDDVVAKTGTTVECVAVTGNEQQGYQVTVTTVEGDNVSFDYKAAP